MVYIEYAKKRDANFRLAQFKRKPWDNCRVYTRILTQKKAILFFSGKRQQVNNIN